MAKFFIAEESNRRTTFIDIDKIERADCLIDKEGRIYIHVELTNGKSQNVVGSYATRLQKLLYQSYNEIIDQNKEKTK